MEGLLTCSLCGGHEDANGNRSPVAVMVMHWMQHHPAEYVKTHPEAEQILIDAGVLEPSGEPARQDGETP